METIIKKQCQTCKKFLEKELFINKQHKECVSCDQCRANVKRHRDNNKEIIDENYKETLKNIPK